MDDTTTKYPKETADVHKRFTIAKGEFVVTHFSCAHKGKFLKQGRLYITQNHLCFYAHILGKTHKKQLDFTDVADIEKAHYGVFPNAIKITTLKNKEIVFASFLLRDQAYDAIRQEWLNIKGRTAVYRANGSDEATEPKEATEDKEEKKGKDQDKEKKKHKRMWSRSHNKKGSVDNTEQRSESDVEMSDVSTNGASKNKRHSISSETSTDSKNSRDSRRNSTPNISSAPSTPSSTPSSRNSTPSAPTPNVASNPPPSPSPSRGDRAEKLIQSGAIVTSEEPANPVVRQSQQEMLQSPAAEQPPAEKPLWQQIFFCCY